MQSIWYQAIHGPIMTRVALWGAAAVYLLPAFVLDLGWWGFLLRAGVLLFLAGLAAHALTTRVTADRWGRMVLWIVASGIVGLVMLGIMIAAFDGEGAP